MRIAIFTETFLPKIDGISNRLRYTVEELVAAGHEVRVLGPRPRSRSTQERKSCEFPVCPSRPTRSCESLCRTLVCGS